MQLQRCQWETLRGRWDLSSLVLAGTRFLALEQAAVWKIFFAGNQKSFQGG
jgi:hypothetical protein